MIFFNRIKSNLVRRGIRGTIIYGLQKVLGISKLQEETAALYYFLEQQIEPKDLPRTKNPDLRLLQDCDTMLLGIFDRMCHKYGLTYWIEYGTLLGAVRHQGFIPWDDDTDIAMPRDDFEKAYELMHDELQQFGISLEFGNNKLAWLQLHYRHLETGIWIDITPMDSFISSKDIEETRQFLYPLISKYIKYYDSHMYLSEIEIWKKKNEIIFCHQDDKGESFLFHGQEFRQTKLRAFRESDLMPCQRMMFNGIELNAPANPDVYLSYVYSKKYMGFPHSGILHHGEASGRPPLDQWAKLHGVNMQEIYEKLCKIYSGF